MSVNMFAIAKSREPLTRATVGVGLALAVIGAIGLGSGVAGASPQQPVLVDDPVPVPAATGPNAAAAVNIANAIFSEFGSLLDSVFPGSGSLFTPVTSGTNPLSPGYPTPALPGQGPTLPGQTPALPGQIPALPGQTPALPGLTPVLPGQIPALPGQTPALPGQIPALPSYPGPVTPADTSPVV